MHLFTIGSVYHTAIGDYVGLWSAVFPAAQKLGIAVKTGMLAAYILVYSVFYARYFCRREYLFCRDVVNVGCLLLQCLGKFSAIAYVRQVSCFRLLLCLYGDDLAACLK